MRGRVIIAVIVGSGVSGLLAIAAAVLLSVARKDELPTWFPAKDMLAAIIGAVWLYEATMATIGATVSVSLARKKRNDEPSPG
jgi:fructose-specific phosphotransferase system IIC component